MKKSWFALIGLGGLLFLSACNSGHDNNMGVQKTQTEMTGGMMNTDDGMATQTPTGTPMASDGGMMKPMPSDSSMASDSEMMGVKK